MRNKLAIAGATLVVALAATGPAQAGTGSPKSNAGNWSSGRAGCGWYLPDLAKLNPLADRKNWSGAHAGNGWYLPDLLAAVAATTDGRSAG